MVTGKSERGRKKTRDGSPWSAIQAPIITTTGYPGSNQREVCRKRIQKTLDRFPDDGAYLAPPARSRRRT
jgi:hypothetical protein